MGEHEDQPGDKLRQKIRCHMMERKISPALSQLPGDPDIRTLPELEHLPADQPGQRRPVGKCDAKGHAPEALSAGKGDQDQKQHVGDPHDQIDQKGHKPVHCPSQDRGRKPQEKGDDRADRGR